MSREDLPLLGGSRSVTARAAVAHSRAPVLLVGLVTTVLAVVLRLGLAGAQVTMVDVEVQVVLRV